MISRIAVIIRDGIRRVNVKGLTTNSVYNARIKAQFIPVRNFGIMDSVMNMANQKIESTKEDKFTSMIKIMIDNKKWTMKPWKATMDNTLSGWTMYIPGVSSSTEATELKSMKAMMDSMTDAELEAPDTIKQPARERISKASGKNLDEVTKLLWSFKQSLIVHTWLHARKDAGEKIPQTQAEMIELQERDPRIRSIATKIMKQNSKKQGGKRGRGMF
jgi:hypothetical protein